MIRIRTRITMMRLMTKMMKNKMKTDFALNGISFHFCLFSSFYGFTPYFLQLQLLYIFYIQSLKFLIIPLYQIIIFVFVFKQFFFGYISTECADCRNSFAACYVSEENTFFKAVIMEYTIHKSCQKGVTGAR